MTITSPGERTKRFCSETCHNVYFSNTTKEPIALDLDSSAGHPLLLSFDIVLPRPTGDYSRAEISVYMGNGTEAFPKESLYVVYHHSTSVDQQFLEYFIHEDCSFSHMLHYYGSKECPAEMHYAVKFAKTILTEKLQELGIENLKVLVNFILE